jgi:hypothetical protein
MTTLPHGNTESTAIPPSARTQREKILRLLLDAKGGWIPSPQIAALALQYNSRIFELRRFGWAIENQTEIVNDARHSWFRLVLPAPEPAPEHVHDERKPPAEHTECPGQAAGDLPLFVLEP